MSDWDATDYAILRALSRDATQSAGALGRMIGLSQPATWRRIKRLEQVGILAGRRIELDAESIGFGVTVFLGVKLATKGRVSLEDFERAVTAIPEVQSVQHVLGLYDYRLRVVARDISDFERVLRRRIMALPGVGNVEANVLLSEERMLGVRWIAQQNGLESEVNYPPSKVDLVHSRQECGLKRSLSAAWNNWKEVLLYHDFSFLLTTD